MSTNKPIDKMTVDDCVRAWVQECDLPVKLDKKAYRDLVSRCEKLTDAYKLKKSAGRGPALSQCSVIGWSNFWTVPVTTRQVARLETGLKALSGCARPSYADPIPGEYGTAYSVTEARMVVKGHKLSGYHQEIILWLCDEVDRLKALSEGVDK